MQPRIPSQVFLAVPIVLSLGLVSNAGAEPAEYFTYDVVADCPTQQAFVAAVESRGSHFDVADQRRSARTFAVTIRKGDDGFTGSLEVKGRDVASAARTVHGTACSDVVDALAIVTAIELRPENDETPAPAPATKSVESHAPLAQTSSKLHVSGFRGKSSWGSDEVAVGAGTLRFSTLLNWTLSLGAAIGPFPRVLFPRYDIVFRFANAVTTPDGHQRINGPILRTRATVYGPPTVTYRANGSVTEFNPGVALGLGACWSPHYDSRGLALLACADFGYVQLGMTPVAADGTRSPTKMAGFGTGGPLLEIEYNLGAWLHVGARAGFDVVMGQFTAVRADGSEAWKTNPWSAYGSLGVGLHF